VGARKQLVSVERAYNSRPKGKRKMKREGNQGGATFQSAGWGRGGGGVLGPLAFKHKRAVLRGGRSKMKINEVA